MISTVAGGKLGLSDQHVYVLAGLCACLVLSIMGEDIAKYVNVDLPEDRKAAHREKIIEEVKEKIKP